MGASTLGAARFHSHWEEQCREASSLTPQPGSQLWNTSRPGLNSALCLGMCWPDRISGGGWHSEERAAKCLSTMQNSFCCILHWKSKWKAFSRVQLFATPWTKQPMEFPRPEYWSGYPFPSPGDLANPWVEPRSPTLQVVSLPAEPPGKPKCLKRRAESCRLQSKVVNSNYYCFVGMCQPPRET